MNDTVVELGIDIDPFDELVLPHVSVEMVGGGKIL
jgi:hypothetical protein